MERALKPHDSAKWTVATYLPFLWQPEKHMFLKPEVTKDFAARVGHRFATDYEARLDFSVYEKSSRPRVENGHRNWQSSSRGTASTSKASSGSSATTKRPTSGRSRS